MGSGVVVCPDSFVDFGGIHHVPIEGRHQTHGSNSVKL